MINNFYIKNLNILKENLKKDNVIFFDQYLSNQEF